MVRAKFLSRFLAWYLDYLILGFSFFPVFLIFFVLAGIVGGIVSSDESTDQDFFYSGLFPALFFVSVLFQFLYYGYFWSKDGQSLCMKTLKIKVIRRGGGDLSFWWAGLRGTVGYWISNLIFCLGYIWAAFDSEGEAWHDKIFDTWVVE